VVTDAEPQRSTCEWAPDDVVRRTMPSATRSRPKRLETQEEIERALRIAPTCSTRIHCDSIVLVALVLVCLVMAVIVWWRLLT
jgi:hypothetical protein